MAIPIAGYAMEIAEHNPHSATDAISLSLASEACCLLLLGRYAVVLLQFTAIVTFLLARWNILRPLSELRA